MNPRAEFREGMSPEALRDKITTICGWERQGLREGCYEEDGAPFDGYYWLLNGEEPGRCLHGWDTVSPPNYLDDLNAVVRDLFPLLSAQDLTLRAWSDLKGGWFVHIMEDLQAHNEYIAEAYHRNLATAICMAAVRSRALKGT